MVVCGSGVATSTVAVNKIKEYLKSHNIDARVFECRLQDVNLFLGNTDLIVSMPMNAEYPEGIPVVKGLPLITGIGAKETLEEIKKILTELKS